jgi:hypothetical protein
MTASNKTPTEAIDSALSCHFTPDSYVTLLVGSDEHKMIAYSRQLTQDSDFFVAAMKKEWAEGQTRTIKLPEESPATMAHYLSYLYSGKLFTEDIKSVPGKEILPCFELLASLYVACERLLNSKLQCIILDEIKRLNFIPDENNTHWYPTAEIVAIIYNGTPESSPGRDFLVDLYVASPDLTWLSCQKSKSFVTEFVIDAMQAMHDKATGLQYQLNRMAASHYYG